MNSKELKYYVDKCSSIYDFDCEDCPYFNEDFCSSYLMKDTIKCISELEEKISELEKKVKETE